MNRKVIAVFLAVLMACACFLTGCGNKDGGSSSDPSGGASSQEAGTGGSSSQETGTGGTDSSGSGSSQGSSEDAEEHTYDQIRGFVDGAVYTNEYFGISFTTPGDDWLIADDAYLAQLAGVVSESVNDDDLQEVFKNSGVAFDFVTACTTDNSNVNVVMQDMGMAYGGLLGEETILKAGKETVVRTFEAQGYANAYAELSKTEFLGKESTCVISGGEVNGSTVHQMQVVVKEGRYVATITATTIGEDGTADLIARFVRP